MAPKNNLLRFLAHIVLLFMLGSYAFATAETLYISDELKVALRSGASTQHRIISFLTSGAELSVLETSVDGDFYRVNVDGKEGWVKAEYVMKSASARAQLPVLNKRIDVLKADIRSEKATTAELSARIKQLEEDKRALEKTRDGINDSLENLKQVAAKPFAIAQQNKELEAELAKIGNELAFLQNENAFLRDRNIKEWFMIGGGVSLASLFFGLIIPNIRWRRKRDSWGGGI